MPDRKESDTPAAAADTDAKAKAADPVKQKPDGAKAKSPAPASEQSAPRRSTKGSGNAKAKSPESTKQKVAGGAKSGAGAGQKVGETATQNGATWIGLHSLAPAPGSRRPRKRVGRGHGSGTGKTSGRGHKGQGSRSGGKPGPAYEGGQTPIHMRMPKLRGATKKTSMPIGPFRTETQPVNLEDLERCFEDGATVDHAALKAKGLAKRRGVPVKILARGTLTKKLTVNVDGFSSTARVAIEAAGGVCAIAGDGRVAGD